MKFIKNSLCHVGKLLMSFSENRGSNVANVYEVKGLTWHQIKVMGQSETKKYVMRPKDQFWHYKICNYIYNII